MSKRNSIRRNSARLFETAVRASLLTITAWSRHATEHSGDG